MADQSPGQWNVLALLNWTRGRLERAGAQSPRLAAEVLLAAVLGCRRIELYTRYDYLPAEEELARFRDLIRRAALHEPVAYLVGEREFYSLSFKVTPDVLVPRPETEILVEQAVSKLRSLGRPGIMWDVCTGSGCVAIATAKQVNDLHVLATDISAAALAVAARNVAAHKLEERVQLRQADLLTLPDVGRALPAVHEISPGLAGDARPTPPAAGSLLPVAGCLLPVPSCFDVITANPPYISDGAEVAPEVSHEPAVALRGGGDGLDFIRRIIGDAPRFLRPGGALIMEFGIDQGPAIRDLLQAGGGFNEAGTRILADHQGIERALVAERKAP